jgi:hypothetical protein
VSGADAAAFDQWCPDGTCYARVSVAGPTLGFQLEPTIRHLSGTQIAERVMACNDVAYLKGRVAIRTAFEKEPGLRSLEGLETQADLNAAIARLQRFAPKDQQQ